MTGSKRCSECKAEKPREAFSRNKSRSDGLAAQCKACASDCYRRWKEANPDKAREANRRWKEANADRVRETNRRWKEANADRVRETKRRWREANPDKAREATRRWEEANPDKVRAKHLRWKKANPEKVYAVALRRFHRLQTAPGGEFSLERPEYRARCAEFGFKCAYCGGAFQTLDHVVPISRGGSNHPENIVPACKRCNNQKNARTPEEWIHRWYLEEEK